MDSIWKFVWPVSHNRPKPPFYWEVYIQEFTVKGCWRWWLWTFEQYPILRILHTLHSMPPADDKQNCIVTTKLKLNFTVLIYKFLISISNPSDMVTKSETKHLYNIFFYSKTLCYFIKIIHKYSIISYLIHVIHPFYR